MNAIEVSAKTLDEAIQKACIELGVPSEQLNIRVLEEGSKGMLGLFSKDAKIEVSLKEEDVEEVKEEVKAKAEKAVEAGKKAAVKASEKVAGTGKKAAERAAETGKKAAEKASEAVSAVQEYVTATGEKVTIDDSLEKRIREANAKKASGTGEKKDGGRKREGGRETAREEKAEPVAPVCYEIPADADAVCEQLKSFLLEVLGAMGLKVTVTAAFSEEGILEADIESAEELAENQDSGMGVIIGKRGNTLDSLQYLATLVLNKGRNDHLHIKLDTEGYRKRRQETLENLALGTARKVKKSGRRIVLDPMNPYERRIIHSALQNERGIETYSEGEEPYRKVVIAPVRGAYRR